MKSEKNTVISETIKALKSIRNFSIANAILCAITGLIVAEMDIRQGVFTGMNLNFIDLSLNNVIKTIIFIVMLSFITITKTSSTKIFELQQILDE